MTDFTADESARFCPSCNGTEVEASDMTDFHAFTADELARQGELQDEFLEDAWGRPVSNDECCEPEIVNGSPRHSRDCRG